MAVSAEEIGFDQILKNTEFENEQQLKSIKSEQERIECFQSQLKEKQTEIVQYDKAISGLDEHAKQLHKQFLLNRDNCDSLKKTAMVLADHEEALKAKLLTTQKEVESERCQQSKTFAKYAGIWETYRVQYSSTEKAQNLEHTQSLLDQLCRENAALEENINQTKQAICTLKQKREGVSLINMVLKMARLHVNTEKVKKELNTGNKQERQLQKKIRDLHEKIKYLEIKKQKEIEEREIQKKNTSGGSMEIEKSTSSITTQPTPINAVPNIQQPPSTALPTNPRMITVSKPSTPVLAPFHYTLEIPKLSLPIHSPLIRTPTLSTQPLVAPKPRPASFQVPTLSTLTVRPRATVPLLHTPIQQRPQPLSFNSSQAPNVRSKTPSVSLTLPNARSRPSVSTLVTAAHSISPVIQSCTTITVPAQQVSNAEKENLSRMGNQLMANQMTQEEMIEGDNIDDSSMSQESHTSFTALFASDDTVDDDFGARSLNQDSNQQQSTVVNQQQLEFGGADETGRLFLEMEGSLPGLGGSQPANASVGDIFSGDFGFEQSSNTATGDIGFSLGSSSDFSFGFGGGNASSFSSSLF